MTVQTNKEIDNSAINLIFNPANSNNTSKNVRVSDGITFEESMLEQYNKDLQNKSTSIYSNKGTEVIDEKLAEDFSKQNSNDDEKLQNKILIMSPLDIAKIESKGKSIDEMTPQELSSAVDEVFSENEQVHQEKKSKEVEKVLENLKSLFGDDFTRVLEGNSEAVFIGEDAKNYLITNDMKPTVVNIYKAMHSNSNYSKSSSQMNVTDEELEGLEPQIMKIIEESGLEVSDINIDAAKELVKNNIPLTQKNIIANDNINKINSYTIDDIKEIISIGLEEGISENEMSLLPFDEEIYNQFFDKNASLSDVTARRQMEEIRLAMTLEAGRKLAVSGIDIRTEELDRIVDELRKIENNFKIQLLGESYTPENYEILDTTMNIVEELKLSSADILGRTMSVQDRITLPELYNEAVSGISSRISQNAQNAGERYETLMTAPRKDMGDSIQKAFRNVDAILEDLGFEINVSNQRAVRILGYNSMDITVDNIMNIKVYDEKVQALMRNLTPKATVELIRNDINPLEMTIDELNNAIKELDVKDDGQEYARFLWKMDVNGEITPEERESYIGIYRVLNAINKSDGAIIGMALEAGMEMNLKNMVKAFRINRSNGIDLNIDDDFGATESITRKGKDIISQIQSAYSNVIDESLDLMSIDALHSIKEQGVDIFELSIEKFRDLLADNQENVDNSEYYGIKLENLKEIVDNSKAAQNMLENLGIKPTIANIVAAENVINSGGIATSIRKLVAKNNMRADGVGAGEVKDDAKGIVSSLYDDNIGTETVDDKNSVTNSSELNAEIEILDNLLKDSIEKLNNKNDIKEHLSNIADCADKIIKLKSHNGNISASEFNELRLIGQDMRFALELSSRQYVEIPVKVGDEVTNINLTLIKDGSLEHKVDIQMDLDEISNVSISFKLSDNRLKGIIVSNQRETVDKLRNMQDDLLMKLKSQGIEVTQLDYGVGSSITKYDELAFGEADSDLEENTNQLYSVAKLFIQEIVKNK